MHAGNQGHGGHPYSCLKTWGDGRDTGNYPQFIQWRIAQVSNAASSGGIAAVEKLPPVLPFVDPHDKYANSGIEDTSVKHLRRDGEKTTLLRCKADKARTQDVWTNPHYLLEPNENLTLLRLNAPGEQDFAFVRTSSGVEGFVLLVHLDTTKSNASRITRVASTAEALQALEGDLKRYVSLPPSKFRVMTNNVRVEKGQRNYNAGSHMAHAMRSMVRAAVVVTTLVFPLALTFCPRATVARSSCFVLT